MMHALPELYLDFGQLAPHAFGVRLSLDHKLPVPGCPAVMRETQERERLRLALTSFTSTFSRIASELDQTSLVRVQFQPELF